MDTYILRTKVFVKMTLKAALSCWKGIEHLVATASRQISDFSHRHSFLGRSMPRQPSIVGPNAREAVIERDLAAVGNTNRRDVHQKALRSETRPGRETTNREAIQRGDNERMMVQSENLAALRRRSETSL
jgi:hypothetical protein